MSNWMNYRPSSILQFWFYKQMTRHTRNPPISIRSAEKSKSRKWNAHNVMHHNGSGDQNIAGKHSNLIIGCDKCTNQFPKMSFSLEWWSEGSRILTLDPPMTSLRSSIRFNSSETRLFNLFQTRIPTWHYLNTTTRAPNEILKFIFRECMITICSRCCKSGNIPQCSTITSHHQHFATNVSRFKSRMG